MNTKVMDLVPYLKSIQEVLDSPFLDKSERTLVLKEMHYELPPEFYCNSCGNTRKIIEKILKENLPDGRETSQKATGKSPAKAKNTPAKGAEKQLLLDTNVHPRGEGTTEGVVNEASKKRRTSKRST